ncbi:hypothetical protein BGX28_001035, partial [Mortierella sp. GBA30]
MTDNHLTLFCLIDGEAASSVFPVSASTTTTIGDLKDLIKTKIANDFRDVDADKLTLWRVTISNTDENEELPISLESLNAKKLRATSKLSMIFADLPEDAIHVIVQRPLPGPSFKMKRHRPHTLMEAIEEAGLKEKAVVDGQPDLSRLDNKERVSLLDFVGQEIDRTDTFDSLSKTALELKGADMKDTDKFSAPPRTRLPVVGTSDLYVREAYRHLYDTILETFENNRPFAGYEAEKHIVVTGTSGIGISAFLVYLAIRLLAESDDDNPPIIVFHIKRSAECYVFGGRST